MHFTDRTSLVARLSRCLLLFVVLNVLSSGALYAAGTISGQVFRDYDANGADNGDFEPGIGAVTVTAFDATGAVAGTTTTCSATGAPTASCTLANLGSFTLTVVGSGPYRVEFTGFPDFLSPGPEGAGSGSTVQFVPDPSGGTATGVDVGLADPTQHCLAETRMVAACYVNGDPLTTPAAACPDGGSAAADLDAFVSFLDNANSHNGTGVVHVADADVIGSVWGVAWQRESGSLFAAANLKRHVGLGPLPAGSSGERTGVIYRLTGDLAIDDGATVEAWFNLDDIPGVDTGPEPVRALDPCSTARNYDPNAFDAVGKIGLGGLEIGDGGESLWVVNLFDRTLYEVAIGNPPTVPTAADVTAHPFGAAEPSCTNGVFRPWAITAHDGMIYVGGVCTGENAGTAADLTAHILAHDPTGVDGNFTQIFETTLDYPRGFIVRYFGVGISDVRWKPWINEWADIAPVTAGPFGQTFFPQAILADLAFDIDGSILLGIMDRAGNQLGNENYQTTPPDTHTYEGVMSGDLLRVCFDPDDADGNMNPFVLESGADCPGPGGPTLGVDQAPPQGPGGREYYWADYHRWVDDQNNPDGGIHQEIVLGGLAHRFGSGEIGASAFDPVDDVSTGGVIWMGNDTGARTHSLEIFGRYANGGQPATFGKVVSIGDLELLCDRAPLEIGNRVWCDDGDGVQEGGEAPIPGVTVRFDCGGAVVTTVTDGSGLYSFDDGDYLAANGTRIPRGASCTLSIDSVAATAAVNGACGAGFFRLSPHNSGVGPSPDLNDSDGIDVGGGIIEASVTVGQDGDNNHRYDFGFFRGSFIGDTVWCDGLERAGNGTFDSGEGVAGVTVTLFEDTNCDDLADGPPIGTQDTAGDGQYLFSGLPTGPAGSPVCYVVRIDASDADLGPCNAPITLTEHAPDLDVNAPDARDSDFGFVEPLVDGSIGDVVWCDGLEGFGNGTFEAGEGVDGVAVSLFEDTDCDDVPNGVAVATRDTAGDGGYLFTGLDVGPPGNPVCYVVRVDAADADLGTCTAALTSTELAPDLDNDNPDALDNDFGFAEPLVDGSIGDAVWCDGFEGFENGTFEAGEGVDGVAVSLFEDTDCDDVPNGVAVATRDTAGDGGYLFTGLDVGPPGNPVCYVVRVDAADADLGTCNTALTPTELSPDLDNDNPDALDNDFRFGEPCDDSDGDRVCSESCIDDRDGDGDPDCSDFDPRGYLYCEDTGEIVSGGRVDIVGPGMVTVLEDGSTGRYDFVTDGTPGLYTLMVTPPASAQLSDTCTESGILDPSGQPAPLVLGEAEVLDTGVLSTFDCGSNPYFLEFDLEVGDPTIINNNIPLQQCAPPVTDIPTVSTKGFWLLAVLLILAAGAVLRREPGEHAQTISPGP